MLRPGSGTQNAYSRRSSGPVFGRKLFKVVRRVHPEMFKNEAAELISVCFLDPNVPS